MGNEGKESAVVSTRWIVVRNVGENGWTTEESFEVRGTVERRTTRFAIVAVEIIVRNVASQSANRNVTIGWIGGSRERNPSYTNQGETRVCDRLLTLQTFTNLLRCFKVQKIISFLKLRNAKQLNCSDRLVSHVAKWWAGNSGHWTHWT